jgi:chemotaxis protein methyltransferase CheR
MVRQAECVEFLQWCLPRMRMRWEGFRKVRSQVCKRIGRRMRELDLEDFGGYKRYLEAHSEEWTRLDGMSRVTISRFYRDRGVFEALETEVLPELSAAALERCEGVIRAWSCGCASGEEAYSLAIVWRARVATRFPQVQLEIIATDADPGMIERARSGVYSEGSLRELPPDLRQAAFEGIGEGHRIRASFREGVDWLVQDVRTESPRGPFDLVLCRNLVLTYYDETLQREVIERVASAIRPRGAAVIGSHERFPDLDASFEAWSGALPIYRLLE